MDYMDPDVLCPQKANKLNLSLSVVKDIVLPVCILIFFKWQKMQI